MNDLSDMTDLSFTQTSRAMASKPLNRSRGGSKTIWNIAAENNAKPKQLRVTKCKDDSVFMGC